MNICHSNILPIDFMQGHHIVIDGFLKITLSIEAISHLDETQFLRQLAATFIWLIGLLVYKKDFPAVGSCASYGY